jgi:hypothetical protein
MRYHIIFFTKTTKQNFKTKQNKERKQGRMREDICVEGRNIISEHEDSVCVRERERYIIQTREKIDTF